MSEPTIPTLEDIHEAARTIWAEIEDGLSNLDPWNPYDQVLVAGANLIVEATAAGLGPEDVFRLIRENARTETEAGGYL